MHILDPILWWTNSISYQMVWIGSNTRWSTDNTFICFKINIIQNNIPLSLSAYSTWGVPFALMYAKCGSSKKDAIDSWINRNPQKSFEVRISIEISTNWFSTHFYIIACRPISKSWNMIIFHSWVWIHLVHTA